MEFSEAIKICFSKYVSFSGRARRSEYWYFNLFGGLVSIAASVLSVILPFLSFLSPIFSLALFLPTLGVTIRRLHDVGKSGKLYLGYIILAFIVVFSSFVASQSGSQVLLMVCGGLAIAMLIFGLYMLVLFCSDSQPGENDYGPNPKNEGENPINVNY